MAAKYVSLEELEEYGMVVKKLFKSEEDCYEFYNGLAWDKGFGVRWSTVRYKKGTKTRCWRRICCHRAGFRETRHFDRMNRTREPRALTRRGCLAKIEIQLCEKRGLWFVKDYVDKHNHPLATPSQVKSLWSHRSLSDVQKAEAVELSLGGLRTCQVMQVMENYNGGSDNLGFVKRDLYNFFATHKKRTIQGSDAEFVLSHMKGKMEEDVEYFFKHSVDDEGRLKNLFWADSQSQRDFSAFGGVMVFDSTYRVNRYNLPFVPFIGVNHHRSTVVFGCGLISDETVDSYVWLLEAFLEAMRQKAPRSVITDGDYSMAKAIGMVMRSTDHRLCSWHIERNMVVHLREPKLSEFRTFIYDAMEIDEFERRWLEFKMSHGITKNDLWICHMYDLRKKWSAAYTKGRYFLGMQSNQRSESLNSTLHHHMKRTMSLVDLVEHYEYCLSVIRSKEEELDAKASLSVPFTRISADPLEKSAARIYTPAMFKRVRQEIQEIIEWQVDAGAREDGYVIYEVLSKANMQHRIIVRCTFDGSLLSGAFCRCKKLECEDIPCVHIFSVVKFLGCISIPRCLVRIRWTMKAKEAFESDRTPNTHVWSEQMNRFRELRNIGNEVFFKASKSLGKFEKQKHLMQSCKDESSDNDGVTEGTSFGPLPAHFSGSYGPSGEPTVDPVRVTTKGAPCKRKKPFNESRKKRKT